MKEFQIQPDVVTYSTIMNAWSQAGFQDKCKQIFDNMLQSGVKPDVHAYSILVKGYVRSMETEKAEELLGDMIESGVRPNVVTFTNVISGWGSSGRMDNAIKIFDKMCELGVSPNLRTFEALIWGYAKADQPWKSEEILQLMEEFHVHPKKSTFLLVSKAWRFAGLTEEAIRLRSISRAKQRINSIDEDGNVATTSERIYQKPHIAPLSSLLQCLPSSVGSTDKKGTALGARRNSRLPRDADLVTTLISTKFKCHSRTCRFVEGFSVMCHKRFQGQRGTYQLTNSCTPVFLN